MNRIRLKIRNPYSENREPVAAQEPIAPPVALLLLWEIMPIVAINFNNKTAIRNQEITDHPIYGSLGNILNAQRIEKFSYFQFWLADKRSSTGIVPVKRKIMALNRTKAPSAFFNTALGYIKLFATFFTGPMFTSSASGPLARCRTKSLACIKGWLKRLAANLARNRLKSGSNSFAFARTKLPSSFTPMLKNFAANLTDFWGIATTCSEASQRTKPLIGWYFAYYNPATVFTGELT